MIAIDGGPLESADFPGAADKAPIVLLHEGLGSVELWRDFPGVLGRATGRRVVSFSRFGHGASPPPPRPRTPAFFSIEADQVLPAVLAALDIERPLLVGHSDGASIALVHAAGHPIAGAVLMAPHVFVEELTLAAIRETRDRFEHGDLRARLARHHEDVNAAFWGWCGVWLDPAFAAWSLDDETARVEAPLLLVQGRDDRYGSLRQIERIAALARGPVEQAVVPGGHSPQFDAREETLAAITRFAAALG